MGRATFDYSFKMGNNSSRVNPGSSNSYAKVGALYKGTNHMGRSIAFEPQRLYNFELQIVGLDSLYTADLQGTAGADSNGVKEGIHFGSAAERIMVACSSFSVPNTEFGLIEIPHYNNTTKYAGKVTFGNATLKIEQFLGSFTEQIMTAWARCVYDPRTQNIGFKNDYAKDMFVIQYDSKGGTPRVWKLENAWPNVLPGANWDYSSTERRQMEYTIMCDRCIPDYGIDTRSFNDITTNFNSEEDKINSILASGITGGASSGATGDLNGENNSLYSNASDEQWVWNSVTKRYEHPDFSH